MKSILVCLVMGLFLVGCDSTSTAFSQYIMPLAQVALGWSASSGSPQGYYVEQSSDGVNFTQVLQTSTNSATVTGVQKGQTYYFRVRAFNQGGNSAYTAVVTASIPAATASSGN